MGRRRGRLPRVGRVVAVAFCLSLVGFLLTGGGKLRRRDDAVILIFAFTFLATAASQSLMLADQDRYVVPFDGFLVLVIAGVVERALCSASKPGFAA